MAIKDSGNYGDAYDDMPLGYFRDPTFASVYGIDTIEYRFKFWHVDEREAYKQIIYLLQQELLTLKLHKDDEVDDDTDAGS
ncbi:hypothetical protein LCGC14_2021300 [marine sediment metagenome]|uniref:Uncharacterized protein n=1 Tax=marine sediment metagenome TaxID=412755 RepID=A0A0F9EXN6_9ZZZZ